MKATLRTINDELRCVPDQRVDSMSIADAEAIKQRAYDEMVKAKQEAWRHLGE